MVGETVGDAVGGTVGATVGLLVVGLTVGDIVGGVVSIAGVPPYGSEPYGSVGEPISSEREGGRRRMSSRNEIGGILMDDLYSGRLRLWSDYGRCLHHVRTRLK